MLFNSPFGPEIKFVELHSSRLETEALSAEERALVANASAKRIREFTLGRQAAKLAIAALTSTSIEQSRLVSILAGPRREPLWPPGIVGSITHSADFAVAAVSHATRVRGIGVDVQSCERALSSGVERRICTDQELAFARGSERKLLQIFSAKETFFKLYYPLCKKFIAFRDVSVLPGKSPEMLEAVLHVTLSAEFKSGTIQPIRCESAGDYILTAAELPSMAM